MWYQNEIKYIIIQSSLITYILIWMLYTRIWIMQSLMHLLCMYIMMHNFVNNLFQHLSLVQFGFQIMLIFPVFCNFQWMCHDQNATKKLNWIRSSLFKFVFWIEKRYHRISHLFIPLKTLKIFEWFLMHCIIVCQCLNTKFFQYIGFLIP